MAIVKRIDWEGWLSGWWVDAVKAATGAALTLGGTNGLDALGMHGVALNWKQALGVMGFSFVYATIKYVNVNPKPAVIVETVDTTFTVKSTDGTLTKQSSSTTTTTPQPPTV